MRRLLLTPLPAGRIVAAIHERVLRHIAALAEEEESMENRVEVWPLP